MVHLAFLSSLVSVALLSTSAQAADCNYDEPRRDGDPSGAAIGADLRGQDNSLLNTVCNGGFPPGSNTISTWNTGSQVYNITRTDPDQPLQYCFDAFDNIITQCIENDNYWGGDWQLDGEIYAIYDSIWPDHVLQAENNPTSSAPSSTTSSSTTSSTSSTTVDTTSSPTTIDTSTPPGATIVTTTIDGAPITETFVPTTIPNASPTTTTTDIDGVIVPLIIGAGGIAWIPFVPVGGAPPATISPPSDLPDDGDDGDDSTRSTSSTSSSSSSSSSSQSRPNWPDDILPGDPGTAKFDAAAATNTAFFGSVPASTTSSSSSSDNASGSSSAPPATTSDPYAAAKKECHDRCASNPSILTSEGQWCMANCGCFQGAAGC